MDDSSINAVSSQNNEVYQARLAYCLSRGYPDAIERAQLKKKKSNKKAPNRSLNHKVFTNGQSDVVRSASSSAYLEDPASSIPVHWPKNFGYFLEPNVEYFHRSFSYDEIPDRNLENQVPKILICGLGCLTASGTLIFLGADSNGATPSAWFWSALIVISSSILLSLRFNHRSFKCWVEKSLGLAILLVGYLTMHTSISQTKHDETTRAIELSPEVVQLEKAIEDLEQRLAPTRAAIAAMDPLLYRTAIVRLQHASRPLEDSLAEKRLSLIEAKKDHQKETGARLIELWGRVDWLRRLILEPLNILCLHGFLEGLPALMKTTRRRSLKFVPPSFQVHRVA